MPDPLVIDDSEIYVRRFSDICTFCKHFKENSANEKIKICTAFPRGKGIPEEIWNGQNDHTKPYKGDHGIQFELHPGVKQRNLSRRLK